ncbi:MAG TPA: class I SAM-dependent methyltransferase [Candidatus Tectomicrobia bacterium]|nr:class I SAM-dependent methyltransferase [Candidatus Tectomicrobia bacterium]
MRDSGPRAEPAFGDATSRAGSAAPPPACRLSTLKRHKLAAITRLLGPTDRLRCLDLGADNGVISFWLRRGGGDWTSADLDAETVAAIERLVGGPVHRLDGPWMPFSSDSFDRIVIVDLLEHLDDDRACVEELFRILRPGGELIVNVPHWKEGALRRLRLAVGQTDAAHGHVRPGYTRASLRAVLAGRFAVVAETTYGKGFSELLDIATRAVTERLKPPATGGAKGTVLVEEDFRRHGRLFAVHAAVEPALRLVAALDHLLVGFDGHMLIVKARSLKRPPTAPSAAPSEEQR